MTNTELNIDADQDDTGLYCAICSECFDESNEFTDHIDSVEHNCAIKNKTNLLRDNDSYCSLCLQKTSENDDHFKSSDHLEFLNSCKRTGCNMADPYIEVVTTTKKESSKTKKSVTVKQWGSFRDRVLAEKNCVGLAYIQREDNMWFCGLCLETFRDPVDEHCQKAHHAIQCLKVYDPKVAYSLKSVFKENQKKKFSSLLLLKVRKIFEKERNTPEFLQFMLEMEQLENSSVKPESNELATNDVKVDTAKELSAADISIPTLSLSSLEESDLLLECGENSSDPIEIVSLFEEGDRDVIPDFDEPVFKEIKNIVPKGKTVKTMNVWKIPTNDSTMIIGISHLIKQFKYRCDICNVICKENIDSTRHHMTSLLHRKNVINLKFGPPVPSYLDKLKSENATLYTKLIGIEAQKIEFEERKNECNNLSQMRADILKVTMLRLPEPFIITKGLSENDEKLDIVALAKQWDSVNSSKLFGSNSNLPDNAGANTSVLSPLKPDKDNLLVGIDSVAYLSGLSFNCRLCNVKFSLQVKRKLKSHVTGRLHKQKALIKAYGDDVNKYLQHRTSKEGYEVATRIIVQSCILLEKEEIETESQEVREVRSKLLGVKVEQLPLPLITMGNEVPFDLKQAAVDWKSGKKIMPFPKKVLKDELVKVSPTKDMETDKKSKIKAHIDSQNFDSIMPEPSHIVVEIKNEKAKNIFDLCKPLPPSTTENVNLPAKKVSPKLKMKPIQNIDVDKLQKSLKLTNDDFSTVKKSYTKIEEVSSNLPHNTGCSTNDIKSEAKSNPAPKNIGKAPCTRTLPNDICNTRQLTKNRENDHHSWKSDKNKNVYDKMKSHFRMDINKNNSTRDNMTENSDFHRRNQDNRSNKFNNKTNFGYGGDQCIRYDNNRSRGTNQGHRNFDQQKQDDYRHRDYNRANNYIELGSQRAFHHGNGGNGQNSSDLKHRESTSQQMGSGRTVDRIEQRYGQYGEHNPPSVPVVENLSIDINSMKNKNLSDVIAKVINLQGIVSHDNKIRIPAGQDKINYQNQSNNACYDKSTHFGSDQYGNIGSKYSGNSHSQQGQPIDNLQNKYPNNHFNAGSTGNYENYNGSTWEEGDYKRSSAPQDTLYTHHGSSSQQNSIINNHISEQQNKKFPPNREPVYRGDQVDSNRYWGQQNNSGPLNNHSQHGTNTLYNRCQHDSSHPPTTHGSCNDPRNTQSQYNNLSEFNNPSNNLNQYNNSYEVSNRYDYSNHNQHNNNMYNTQQNSFNNQEHSRYQIGDKRLNQHQYDDAKRYRQFN